MLIVSVYDGTVCQHIAIGHLQKVGNWDGGIIISGSRNSYNMFTSSSFDPTTIEVESNRLFCSCRDVYFYPLFNLRNLLYLILPGTAKPPLSAGRAALPQNRCCLGRRIQQQGSGLTPAALLFRFKKAAPEAFASPWVGTACQTPPLPSRPRSSPAACGRHPPRRQDIPLSAP